MVRGSKAAGKSSLRGRWRSQHDEERLPRAPSEGSPRARVLCPLCATRSRAGEDAGGVPEASSDFDDLLLGLGRQGTQGFLASVRQNERNCLAKVRQAFFTRFPLAVGTGHFGAIGDVPWAVLLDNRRELIMHASILASPAASSPAHGHEPWLAVTRPIRRCGRYESAYCRSKNASKTIAREDAVVVGIGLVKLLLAAFTPRQDSSTMGELGKAAYF